MDLQHHIKIALREETLLKVTSKSDIPKTNMFKGFDVSSFKNQDPPKNDSEKTNKEIKYLKSIKLNDKFFKDKDNILDNFVDFLEEKELEYDRKLLKKLISDSKYIILLLKEHYKRPRPFKLDKTFKDPSLKSTTGYSYPSGHSTQSNLVRLVLSKLFPKYKKDFNKIADDIMYSRQMAKAHYPSDIKFGEKLAKALYDYIIDNDLIKNNLNETKFFHRRVNPEEVARNFKLFASETFFDTENYEQFKYELVLKSLEHIMWQEYNMGWEDLPEQQEIDYVNKIAEMYKDVIYSMYLYYYNR